MKFKIDQYFGFNKVNYCIMNVFRSKVCLKVIVWSAKNLEAIVFLVYY